MDERDLPFRPADSAVCAAARAAFPQSPGATGVMTNALTVPLAGPGSEIGRRRSLPGTGRHERPSDTVERIQLGQSNKGAIRLCRRCRAPSPVSRGIGAIVAVSALGSCMSLAIASPVGRSARYPSCGRVHSRYGALVVYVKSGHVSCRKARSVIRYVTSHGQPTQGRPGKSPRGWNCFYGYGYYHGDHRRLGRAGPECQSATKTVEGVDPNYVPA